MSNQPTHHVYFVKESEKKGIWTKVGAAWPHKDGKGFNIELDLIPVASGDTLSLTLREPQEKSEASGQESQAA